MFVYFAVVNKFDVRKCDVTHDAMTRRAVFAQYLKMIIKMALNFQNLKFITEIKVLL